jgi:hypothetical protein
MAFWERSNGGSVWTVGRPEVILGPHITSQLAPSLDKSSPDYLLDYSFTERGDAARAPKVR